LKLLFLSGPIGFSSKMMPCKINHNLICFGPRLMSKCYGTKSTFLTNGNAWFHWTLLLGPLFKMIPKVTICLFILRESPFFHDASTKSCFKVFFSFISSMEKKKLRKKSNLVPFSWRGNFNN
jgi:hypothetical protein